MSSGSYCFRALIMLFNPLLCVYVLTYFYVITKFSSRTETNTFSMTLAYRLLSMLYYYKIFLALQAMLLIHRALKHFKNTNSRCRKMQQKKSDGPCSIQHSFVQSQVSEKLKFGLSTLDKRLLGTWKCCLSPSAKCPISQLVFGRLLSFSW